jgi:hypothetical protein
MIYYNGELYSTLNYYLINNSLINHNMNAEPNKVEIINNEVTMYFPTGATFFICL